LGLNPEAWLHTHNWEGKEKKEKKKKLHMFRVFDHLQYHSKGGKNDDFSSEKNIMVSTGHGTVLYCQSKASIQE